MSIPTMTETKSLPSIPIRPISKRVRTALEAKKLQIVRAESTLVPKTKIDLAEKEAMQTLRLIDRLEDLDDVQNVYTNAEIADEIAEKYAG